MNPPRVFLVRRRGYGYLLLLTTDGSAILAQARWTWTYALLSAHLSHHPILNPPHPCTSLVLVATAPDGHQACCDQGSAQRLSPMVPDGLSQPRETQRHPRLQPGTTETRPSPKAHTHTHTKALYYPRYTMRNICQYGTLCIWQFNNLIM